MVDNLRRAAEPTAQGGPERGLAVKRPGLGTTASRCLLVVAGAAVSGDLTGVDEEARRVELVARLDRSVVVVLAEGRGISHTKSGPRLLPFEGVGAGVLVSADGLVLTAEHVIAGADRVRVRVVEGEPLPARILFEDEPADVALLRLERVPPSLSPAPLGDSDRVRKGEAVYVIGNPSGVEHSLSVGVVSGRHPARHVFGGSVEAELIQTDAAINAGNSGGPMFNSRGEVIAIAQSILTEGGGSEGLGFGLAINAARKVLGLDPCVWMGFSAAPLNETWAAILNVPRPGALLVERVTAGGPADEAGIRGGEVPVQFGLEHLLLGGDVIVRADGVPILEWIRERRPPPSRPGEVHEIRLTLLRAGQTREVPVRVTHRGGR
jgi:serine protease Do